MPTGRPLSSVWWMIIAAIATDVTVVGAIHLVARAAAGSSVASGGGDESAPGATTDAGAGTAADPATPWAQCLESKDHEPPSIVAITYLDRGRDDAVTLGDVRGWIGKLAPAAVQVRLLEPHDARFPRRIAFEVPAERWPAWLRPDPSLPLAARCLALYTALRMHGVGRPRAADELAATDAMTRSRYDFEFLFPRRQERYDAMSVMGTVADLTEDSFAGFRQWLDDTRPAATP